MPIYIKIKKLKKWAKIQNESGMIVYCHIISFPKSEFHEDSKNLGHDFWK